MGTQAQRAWLPAPRGPDHRFLRRGERMMLFVPADQQGRDRLLQELDTTFFVEAGAGTGKTTALVSRIIELVAADELQMERLAGITFTEAAAAKLRDRLRHYLEAARRIARFARGTRALRKGVARCRPRRRPD